MTESDVGFILRDQIYSDSETWNKFIRLFCLSLGIGLTTAGILFFFAYNWSDLNKFTKIGILQILIIATCLFSIFSAIKPITKNIVLTSASILVGVMYAVYGQIYQTGADAYDFFLGWTLSITVWALVTHFAPLWIIFIGLINTTIILYCDQIAFAWSELYVVIILFWLNLLILIGFLYSSIKIKKLNPPIWFTNLLGIIVASLGTFGVVTGILEKSNAPFLLLLFSVILVYSTGLKIALKNRNSFYLSIISFSIILIISSFLFRLSEGMLMLFFISVFAITSTTIVIKKMINLQKL